MDARDRLPGITTMPSVSEASNAGFSVQSSLSYLRCHRRSGLSEHPPGLERLSYLGTRPVHIDASRQRLFGACPSQRCVRISGSRDISAFGCVSILAKERQCCVSPRTLLGTLVQQLPRRGNLPSIVSIPRLVARSSLPHDLGKLRRRHLLQLPDRRR